MEKNAMAWDDLIRNRTGVLLNLLAEIAHRLQLRPALQAGIYLFTCRGRCILIGQTTIHNGVDE
jgi:hypothetical protein